MTGLLLAVAFTAFAFTSPDGGKDKKKAKAQVATECVGVQSHSCCQGHAEMKAACDKSKCQNQGCDPVKCQGNCDPANCKGSCTGTCDHAKCTKHAEKAKK